MLLPTVEYIIIGTILLIVVASIGFTVDWLIRRALMAARMLQAKTRPANTRRARHSLPSPIRDQLRLELSKRLMAWAVRLAAPTVPVKERV